MSQQNSRLIRVHTHSPSCLLASAQVGSPPRRIITASMTFSTKAGGLPYDLISVMSFLLSDSRAFVASARAGKASSRSCWAFSAITRHLSSSSAIFSLLACTICEEKKAERCLSTSPLGCTVTPCEKQTPYTSRLLFHNKIDWGNC